MKTTWQKVDTNIDIKTQSIAEIQQKLFNSLHKAYSDLSIQVFENVTGEKMTKENCNRMTIMADSVWRIIIDGNLMGAICHENKLVGNNYEFSIAFKPSEYFLLMHGGESCGTVEGLSDIVNNLKQR